MTTQNIVISGATSGMGKVAARELAHGGARLLLTGRSPKRCEAVKSELIAVTGNKQIEFIVADFSTVAEVRRAAAEIRQRLSCIDTLVNNAGGKFPVQRTVTSEGFEIAFVLQYLSRWVLTEELLEPLAAAAQPRVLTIAGGGSYAKDIDIDDLQSERAYKRLGNIGKTAALNELLTLEQTRRHPELACINYGPGLVRTNTTMATTGARIMFQTIGRLFSRSPEKAGREMARLATEAPGGGFYGPNLKRQDPIWAKAHSGLETQLWTKTEELLRGLE